MRTSDLLHPIIYTDLIGFSFGNYHSSQFGLKRVSDGNRYHEYLFPTLKNLTIDTVGNDGTLFFGTKLEGRTFTINLAFDNVSEDDLRDMKEWLNMGISLVLPLIFDERPYILYFCALNDAPQFKYLTFLENGVRIYKGEGSITFKSYYPYGYSIDNKKWIDAYIGSSGEMPEWSSASRLVHEIWQLSGQGQIEKKYDYAYWELGSTMNVNNVAKIRVFNSGDANTDLIIRYSRTSNNFISGRQVISLGATAPTITYIDKLTITIPTSTTTVKTLEINTKLRLVKAIILVTLPDTTTVEQEVLVNDWITNGDFFLIPQGDSFIKITSNAEHSGISGPAIFYKNRFM